jgi:DNA mismatch endonuclease, patch repair protein
MRKRPPSFASSHAVRRKMQAQRRQDTKPELAIRKELFRRGYRYYLHRRPLPNLRRRIDIVFPVAKVAVEVRGCFWHACTLHKSVPKANAAWWQAKIDKNRARDRETEDRLVDAGWVVVVLWEHDDVTQAVGQVERAVSERMNCSSQISVRNGGVGRSGTTANPPQTPVSERRFR